MTIHDYVGRVDYLKQQNTVGQDTFGFDRYLNQQFYKSAEWRSIRNWVITRDNGCDLGLSDRPISGRIYIHHINPLTPDDIKDSTEFLLNPEYLISVSAETHNLIHYGSSPPSDSQQLERKPNDTCPWRH